MRYLAIVAVALFAVGCGSSSTAPTSPTLPAVTVDCTLVGTLPCQTPPTPTPTTTTSFTVSGSVTDGTSGGPLAGIAVVASPTGSTVSTDNLGHYAIAGVKRGQVSLMFSSAGYATQSKTITVAADATVDVALQRAPVAPPPAIDQPITGPITITSLDIPTVQIGTPSSMTAKTTGNVKRFSWSFGDGASLLTGGDGPRVAHRYSAIGSYVVTVTAFNDTDSATTTSTAIVAPAPSLTVTLNCTINASTVSSPCNVSVVDQNGATVTSSLTKVDYDWGDGTVETVVGSPLASHTFALPGVYIIKATVTANSITGSATKTATVS